MGYSAKLTDVWQSWTPTFTGFSADPGVGTSKYMLDGKTCTYQLVTTSGTSNATSLTFTLPFSSSGVFQDVCIVANSGTFATGKYVTTNNSNVVTVYATTAGGAFTASGNKLVNVQITYETV